MNAKAPTKAAPSGMYHAWYSPSMASLAGSSAYRTSWPRGEKEVTCVCSKPAHGCAWDDMQYVGLVTRRWLRKLQPSKLVMA